MILRPSPPVDSLDIVLKLPSLSYPSCSADLFGREGPLFMEIGVGSGGFIADISARHPEANVLGVDRAPQSIARSYRRLRDSPRPNARLMKADARFVLRSVLPPGLLQRVYVNYPDPWPRRKHSDRRLLQRPFLSLLATRLAADGRLFVTTDHREYFDFAVRNADGLFTVDRGEPPEVVLATKWAKKSEEHYHAALVPRGSEPTAGAGPSVYRAGPNLAIVDEMYHAVLEGELPDIRTFEKQTATVRDGVSVVLDCYRTLDGRGLAFLVHVEEKHLSQEVIIEAREGKNGYVVALKRFGEPLHTRGLADSVRYVAEWLEERGMTIIHRKF